MQVQTWNECYTHFSGVCGIVCHSASLWWAAKWISSLQYACTATLPHPYLQAKAGPIFCLALAALAAVVQGFPKYELPVSEDYDEEDFQETLIDPDFEDDYMQRRFLTEIMPGTHRLYAASPLWSDDTYCWQGRICHPKSHAERTQTRYKQSHPPVSLPRAQKAAPINADMSFRSSASCRFISSLGYCAILIAMQAVHKSRYAETQQLHSPSQSLVQLTQQIAQPVRAFLIAVLIHAKLLERYGL